MYASSRPDTIRASRDAGCVASWNPCGGFDHGSHVTIGTAPWRCTLVTQSLRKRVSPLRHCWNQFTTAGVKSYAADQDLSACVQTGRSGSDTPKYAPATPGSSDDA